MSRIGKQPILIPTGVTVKVTGREVSVSGPKGSMAWVHPHSVEVAQDGASKTVCVARKDDTKQSRANHGLSRALIANMVKGVSEGFERRLLIYGTGYGCKLAGRTLHLNVGFSGRQLGAAAQFEIPIPEGLEVAVERDAARGDNEPASMVIRGVDKQQVGEFAAEVRGLRTCEPYKGKGIRYDDEHIRRKQGKALTGTG